MQSLAQREITSVMEVILVHTILIMLQWQVLKNSHRFLPLHDEARHILV